MHMNDGLILVGTARLLELNDLINLVISKYEEFKSGKPITKTDVDAG